MRSETPDFRTLPSWFYKAKTEIKTMKRNPSLPMLHRQSSVLAFVPQVTEGKSPRRPTWAQVGWPIRARLLAGGLMVLVMSLNMQVLRADEVNGTYNLRRISGSLFVKGNREARHEYNYWWGHFFDDGFFDKHSYPIPPEGILAAALGQGIVVKNKRIRINLSKSRAEISKVIRQDPRLNRIIYFNIKSLPNFTRFKGLKNGVLYAKTRQPLLIEVGLEADGGVTHANALADYRAKLKGNQLEVNVSFRGSGGPLLVDTKSYDIEGKARILSLRK